MTFLSSAKSKAESAGRFLASTGKGALQKIGEGARSIKPASQPRTVQRIEPDEELGEREWAGVVMVENN